MKENIQPIKESGQLNFVEDSGKDQLGFELLFMNGHTEKQMLPKIEYQGRTVIFMADLFTKRQVIFPYLMLWDMIPDLY